jgi:hypothetical protein
MVNNMNVNPGKKYFWTSEVINNVHKIYRTATSHREAAIMLYENYGIKTNAETLCMQVYKYKIERPFIKHGGYRWSGKK